MTGFKWRQQCKKNIMTQDTEQEVEVTRLFL